MATNYSIQTHTTRPQDKFEPPFAALHYFVSEHIAGEEKSYSCVVVNTDETREFSDIDALKAAFFKRARTFACNQNLIGIERGKIDASSASVNTMSAMIIGALFDFVALAAHSNKKLENAFESAFAQKVAFKCSDKVVREIPLSQLVEAHKEAVRRITEQYTGKSAKENGDVFEDIEVEQAETDEPQSKDDDATDNDEQKPSEAEIDEVALVAHAKAIALTDGILIADFAKQLCKNGVNVGQNRLFAWLRSEGYLMQGNKPYQTYVDRGYFETSVSTIATNHGAREVITTRITGKGQIALSDKIIRAFQTKKGAA